MVWFWFSWRVGLRWLCCFGFWLPLPNDFGEQNDKQLSVKENRSSDFQYVLNFKL